MSEPKQEEATCEQVLAVAHTLKFKPISEGVGFLVLAFDGMDRASALAALMIAKMESKR